MSPQHPTSYKDDDIVHLYKNIKENSMAKWSEKDIQILKDYYPTLESKGCFPLMETPRSFKSISKKARELRA